MLQDKYFSKALERFSKFLISWVVREMFEIAVNLQHSTGGRQECRSICRSSKWKVTQEVSQHKLIRERMHLCQLKLKMFCYDNGDCSIVVHMWVVLSAEASLKCCGIWSQLHGD